MRRTFAIAICIAVLAAPLAQAQDRRGRDRDDDRGEQTTATVTQLAAADRRLNQIYQRRVADARADDGDDRRFRGWYSQEQALRESERLWINFRDAECRYLTQQDIGRRDHTALLRGCLLDQTEERIADLRSADVMLSQR